MEGLAQLVPIDAGSELFNLFVGVLPDRKRASEQAAPFCGEDEDAAAAVGRIGFNLHQSAAFQRFQGRSQGGSIHRQQGSDRAHRRRLRPIERHEQRELTVSQFEGAQFFIESASQGARCTLHMKTKTTIFHHQSCLERQRFSA